LIQFNKKKAEADKRQQPMTAEDKRQMRRRHQRRQAIVRGVVLVGVCALLVFVWQNWDWLAPDQLFASISDWFDGGTGEYPVDVSGIGAQRLCRTEDYTVLLTDSHLIYYDDNGAEMSRYNCAVPNGLLRAAGDYALLAEQGGKRVYLTTRGGMELEFETEQEILSAALNEEGQFAVLTDGPQGYQVQVKVYDDEGKELYARSRNRTATDVALSPDGNQVALLSAVADNGNLDTYVEAFDLTSGANEATHAHRVKDTLLYRLSYFADHRLAAVGEDRVILLNCQNGDVSEYKQEGKRILGYAVGKDRLALALRSYGATGDGEVHLVNGNTTLVQTVAFIGDFRQLSADENHFLLLTDGYVQRLSEQSVGDKVKVEADGRQAVLDENRAVVLGVSHLQEYELK